MASDPMEQLIAAQKGLLASGAFSDCTIKCGSDEYKVHKSVICPRSKFFEAAFTCDMEEKATGVITLDEEDPDAVRSLVSYMYNLDYDAAAEVRRCITCVLSEVRGLSADDPAEISEIAALEDRKALKGKLTKKNQTRLDELLEKREGAIQQTKAGNCTCDKLNDAQPHLTHHARVYALAEMYGILCLKGMAKRKFSAECTESWNHAAFYDAITEVFQTTPEEDRGLRDIVVDTIKVNKTLLERGTVKTVMKDVPQLSYDIAMMLHEHKGGAVPAGMYCEYWHPIDSYTDYCNQGCHPRRYEQFW